MTLIDLGDVAESTSPPAVPLDHRRLTRIVLAVLAIAGLLALAGSARPGSHGIRPLWTASLADGDTFTLDQDTAYLHRMTGGQAELSAYDLATGTVRWTSPTGTGITGYGTMVAGGVLLLPIDPVQIIRSDPSGGYVFSIEFTRATIAIDPRTGARLWRTDGEISPDHIAGDTALVTEHDDGGKLTGARLLRLPDGRQLWSRRLPGTVGLAVTAGEMVAVTGDGLATVYAYGDGSLLRTGQLRWPPGKAGRAADLVAAGRYFTVVRFSDEANTSTVYQAGDLRPLWNADASRGFVQDCGPLLCTFGPNDVTGHDPRTGQVRWREAGASGIQPLTPDRLLLDDVNGSSPPEAVVIDPTTGQRIGTTTQRVVVVDPGTGRRIGAPVPGIPVATSRPYPSILLLGPTARAGQVAVVRLDVTTGRATPLGVTDAPAERACRSAGRYLACQRDGRLAVTAVG